jgi:hypothetical protein
MSQMTMRMYDPLFAAEHFLFFYLLLITCVPLLLFQVKAEQDRLRHIFKVNGVLCSMICSESCWVFL